MNLEERQRAVHDAISNVLEENEIAVAWVLSVDVAGPDDTRYLAYRAGGGHDGTDTPMLWTCLGMVRAADQLIAEDLLGCTYDVADEEE